MSTSVFVVEHPLTAKLEHLSTYKSRTNVRNPCPHVGAGGLTSGGMPEEEQFLASLGNDKKLAF